LREVASLKADRDRFGQLQQILLDMESCLELLEGEEDPSLIQEFSSLQEKADRLTRNFELEHLLGAEHDRANAIVNINSGAGGTESMDWASMLLRMYTRWGERQGATVELVDIQVGEEAGIKSATLRMEGEYVYGKLKYEMGVHRLVRISPFDANKRRHTSFASVSVYPEIDDAIEIEIKESDLKVDTYRSSGAGGQHVNKTESAIRLTHLPTGLVVACQMERSQHKNRATAMKMLRAALFHQEEEKRKAEQQAHEGTKSDIAWGSQIRSYVLHPYQLVKDYRSDWETSQSQKILDGDLDDLIEANLGFFAKGGKTEA